MAHFLIEAKPVLIAVAGGVLPSLIWLWFWRNQDKDCPTPEPFGIVALSFAAGMVIIYAVIPIEKAIMSNLSTLVPIVGSFTTKLGIAPFAGETIQVALWALVEEIAKYATVFFIAFHAHRFKEPVDAVIYLITAALGFAAMENTLYILKGLSDTGSLQVVIDGNLRFIGATVVHSACSGVVGATLALSFYRTKITRIISVIIGVMLASLLHTYFNLTIMNARGTIDILAVFAPFWIAMIGILILVSIIKQTSLRRNANS
ncbi:MAG: PrsW family glutamic-type intramembrane protease [Candidatus Pacebacteria bacterium]|nr:PrsW family glutamic-type intramembrane protease [Candidatus Paceibacterota bacterium]